MCKMQNYNIPSFGTSFSLFLCAFWMLWVLKMTKTTVGTIRSGLVQRLDESLSELVGDVNESSFTQRCRDIHNTLVFTASKAELDVALSQDERTFHQHVNLLEQRQEAWFLNDLFPSVTCVAPDISVLFLLDALGEMSDGVRVKERVSARERDGKIIVGNDSEQVIFAHVAPCRWRPRLGIVAAFAVVRTAREVDGGTKTWTIYRSAF